MQNNEERILVGSIQKFSIEDGPGIRTTIFLKGCPLNCRWCHNPELIDAKQQLIKSPNNCIQCGYCISICPEQAIFLDENGEIDIDRNQCTICLQCAKDCFALALRPVAKEMTVKEILDQAEQDRGFYENTGGGITISGGEILNHAQFVEKIIDEAKKRNINVCLDTSGFGDSNAFLILAEKENVTDILFDIKTINDKIHKEYTGVSNQLILKNLQLLASKDIIKNKLTIRMPLIKGVNDDTALIKETAEYLKKLGISKVDLLPYHTLGISKMKNIGGGQEEFEAPEYEHIKQLEAIFNEL